MHTHTHTHLVVCSSFLHEIESVHVFLQESGIAWVWEYARVWHESVCGCAHIVGVCARLWHANACMGVHVVQDRCKSVV